MRPSLFKPLTSVTLVALLSATLATGGTRTGLTDLDGDGIANINDPDVDGDGIPNGKDRNVDGGVCRRGPFKGLYVGDRFPNDSPRELDIDGDGRNDDAANENDIDGDGIKNKLDKDRDGDGKKDANDKDDDGDGIPDKKERRSAAGSLKIGIGSGALILPPIRDASSESLLGGIGSLTGDVEIEESLILGPGTSPGTLEVSGDVDLNLFDSDSGSLVIVPEIDQESEGVTEVFAQVDPLEASAWLAGLSESLSGDRPFPEGWFETLLEKPSVESLEHLDSLGNLERLDSLATLDPQAATAWLESLSGDSVERLSFLEKARGESLLRRGQREVSFDAEVEETAPEDNGSPAIE